jgi:hypothetical protein
MSPSRLMAIMDPLLNTGFLWRCLAAYAGIKADDEPPHDELEAAIVTNPSDSQDKVISSPEPVVPDSDNSENPKRTEYIRGDTYYARLGILNKIKYKQN